MIMRNLARSHFEAAVGATAAVAVAGAAEVASFAGAAAALPIDVNTASSTAVTAPARSPASKQELSRAPLAKTYSAAAIRGGPTKPAGSPKRSIMTAVRSLVLLVTQAPERTV